MIETKTIGEFTELSSDKFIRKIGKKETRKRFIMPTEDTVDMYEEVDEEYIPKEEPLEDNESLKDEIVRLREELNELKSNNTIKE